MNCYRSLPINLVSSLLFVVAATAILATVNSADASDASAEQKTGTAEVTLLLPIFPQEDFFLKKHTKPEDDTEFPSGNRMPRPLQILRARNLLAAGHYEEAIVDYKAGLPKWNVPLRFRRTAEREFALAYEKVGKIDDAVQHAKLSGSAELLVKLYLKQQRFEEAKAIADNNVLDNKVLDYTSHYADSLGSWLQVRAVIECHLKQYDRAIDDLKAAARKYYICDTEKSNTCARAANVLIERYKLGPSFKLEASELPAKGKEKVLELVKFLSTSAHPLNIGLLNRITDAEIKLPGKTWRNTHQEENAIRPFDHLEYRSEEHSLAIPKLLMLYIATNECCIPKIQIDSLLPSNARKIPPISIWNESDESPYAEAWKLPTGRLFLRFGTGGARVLQYLEFNALSSEDAVTVAQLKMRAHNYGDENEKKVSSLTDAIKIDDNLIELYVARAIAYCELGRFDEALSDAKRSVSLGGRFYLNEQSLVEEKMGNLDDAINHFKEFLGEKAPGPETAAHYTRLAELYVENKQYHCALETITKAMLDSKDRSTALFVKAQAEAGLGNLDCARADGKASADEYFSKAQIVLRDRVLEWLKVNGM